MKVIHLLLTMMLIHSGTNAQNEVVHNVVVAKGQMPNMAKDKSNKLHIVYGCGDSILYTSSADGKVFSPPALVAVLPQLFASAMRGPQIAASADGPVIIACTKNGDIYAYKKQQTGKWSSPLRVNAQSGVAKEALMALAGDGSNLFAVWLGAKAVKGQHLYAGISRDGGKSWPENVLVYDSPDSTICECCKPSAAMKGNTAYVMFRNWINGSRDMYLVRSSNGLKSFETAQKLGRGSWKLNGCPMDGGGLAINPEGVPESIWRREGKLYHSTPGQAEIELGEGRNGSVEPAGSGNVYAWTESGNVMVLMPDGRKQRLGKGGLPLIKAIDKVHVVCLYENEDQIHAALLSL